jgi:hypothetical protein
MPKKTNEKLSIKSVKAWCVTDEGRIEPEFIFILKSRAITLCDTKNKKVVRVLITEITKNN